MSDLRPPELEEDERDDEFALDPDVVQGVIEALDALDGAAVLGFIRDFHVADIADLLEQIGPERRRRFVELVWSDIDNEVLIEVDEGVRDEILTYLDPRLVAEAARDFETDDVVYLLGDLEPEQQRQVLEALDPAHRIAVARSLTFPEESAGRLMQTDFVRAPAFWTVGQMIDYLRAADNLPEQFYDIVVVDPAGKPIGLIPLALVLGNRRPVSLGGLMQDDFRSFHVEDTQEDVGYAFSKYHLVSAPVVDDDGRVIGVITIDDAVEAMEAEADEDLKRLGGVGDEELNDGVFSIVRQRAPWLTASAITASAAASVISLFEDTISRFVALATLLPIVAAMGGNAGTQSLTVAVRGLATRSLTRVNALRIIRREIGVGLCNGLIFAVLVGGSGALLFGNIMLGPVIGGAIVANMFTAALVGILVPMTLDRLGADPAVSSGTFVTTTCDVVGFFAFLTLATWWLI